MFIRGVPAELHGRGAATMITFGLLAGRIGARRLLLGAVAVYGSASLAAGFAINPEMLVLRRSAILEPEAVSG